MLLGKKIGSVKKLAKKVKVRSINGGDRDERPSHHECLLIRDSTTTDERAAAAAGPSPSSTTTPTGFFAVYVGEERQRFVVPTGFLSHPLFKMLLEKASEEFGFQQKNGLVVPCTVTAFQEVVSAVECCNGQFDFGHLVQEFI